MNNENSKRQTIGWIVFTFLIWIFAFRGYFSSKFTLESDALSYYDHIKFFIENLKTGVFPLWDPYWFNGAPNDFFLRRIGSLNPFYFVILLFKSMGVPYTLSYLWFLAGYYFSGMIAFYLLAMRIYQDRFIAYAGYLILLFSALGTRLFDSYMMLITVPLIWFFYFLVAFSQNPRKHFFLGMVLSFMILVNTYIPFYFLIILCLFLMLYCFMFIKNVPEILYRYTGFIMKNKILIVVSSLIIVLSFIPIITFYHHTSTGQVVLPIRHGNSAIGQTLAVPHQMLDWGAVEDLMYSYYFSDLRLYKFAVVYVPFFSVVLLLLGLIGRINLRVMLIVSLGIVLFCCIVPHGLPFYDFFYKYFFVLKFFRNLHFFIWFFLIPLFVLLALEHWNMFNILIKSYKGSKWPLIAYVLFVHLVVFLFVWNRHDAIISTYLMIVLSLIFWSLMVLGMICLNTWGLALLTLIVIIQPIEVYYYFSLKAPVHDSPYTYDFTFNTIALSDLGLNKPENVPLGKDPLYYASSGYNFIHQNISNFALSKYLQNKFILVDHLILIDQSRLDVTRLEHQFITDDNSAFVYNNRGVDLKLSSNDPNPPQKAWRVDNLTGVCKILSFNANHIRLRLNLPYEKFLIYNDSYDKDWRVSVNRHQSSFYEVNGAFKGVWLPAGESIVEFNYGSWWQYMMNISLSLFAFIILILIVYFALEA